MKNEYFPNFPLFAIIIVLACLEYYFTVGFFQILSKWIPAAGIKFLFVGTLSFALAVISIFEIGLWLLLILSKEIREAIGDRNGY